MLLSRSSHELSQPSPLLPSLPAAEPLAGPADHHQRYAQHTRCRLQCAPSGAASQCQKDGPHTFWTRAFQHIGRQAKQGEHTHPPAASVSASNTATRPSPRAAATSRRRLGWSQSGTARACTKGGLCIRLVAALLAAARCLAAAGAPPLGGCGWCLPLTRGGRWPLPLPPRGRRCCCCRCCRPASSSPSSSCVDQPSRHRPLLKSHRRTEQSSPPVSSSQGRWRLRQSH